MSKKDQNYTNEPLFRSGESSSIREIFKKYESFDRRIEEIEKLYGHVSETDQEIAEEFFKSALQRQNSIFGYEYESISSLDRTVVSKKLKGKFDIILHNAEYSVIIEVKYNLHPNDVIYFIEHKLPHFRQLCHEYADKKIIGAVAGMCVPSDSYKLAEKNGLLVLTQSGKNIAMMNPEGFRPKEF